MTLYNVIHLQDAKNLRRRQAEGSFASATRPTTSTVPYSAIIPRSFLIFLSTHTAVDQIPSFSGKIQFQPPTRRCQTAIVSRYVELV